MGLFRTTLRPNHLLSHRRTPAVPLLRPASSLSAPADDSAASSLEAASRPRSLSSIFAKPSSAASPARKPTAPTVAQKKDRVAFRPSLSSETSRYRPMEVKDFPESLPPEVEKLVARLQEDGYLKDANFSHGGQLEPGPIPATLYSRHFLKSAAEKFGQDHQEIAKWLSGSDLKKVALFGCPSLESKTVFAAKRLRSFFRIQEDIICRGCKIKTSCKFMNQRVGGQDKVILADVMRILTLFAFNSIPKQLFVSNDLKHSVSKLLKEVVNLSS